MKVGKENEKLEFKKTTSELKEGVISMAAILNKHGGGELYFGVRNDGTVLGQTVSDKTLRDISQAVFNHLEPKVYPKIELVYIDDKQCVQVDFSGEEAPYFAYGRAYIRVADEDKVMSPAELENYFLRKIERKEPWDNEASDIVPSDIDESVLKEFMERANQAERIGFTYTNNDDVLNRLNLIKGGKVKNAAVALFRGFGLLEVQMAIFATAERLTFNDINRCGGNITQLASIAERYIRNNIRWRVVFDGSMQRKEIPEIPMDAIREAIINSFCHRDYKSFSQNNEIVIFSNRVEIFNPGAFPEGLTPKDFINGAGYSVKRNPLLAQLMYYVKDIESFGTGLKRISDACDAAEVKVEFQKRKKGFSVVFYRPDAFSISDAGDVASMKVQSADSKCKNCTLNCTLSEKAIIEYVEANPTATQSSIAASIGKSLRSIKTDMAHLQEIGVLKREGSCRDGRWVVKISQI